jgi:nitrogen fixation/metabolism regulation signal transduction histidine kinase
MDFNYLIFLTILKLNTENFKIIWWFKILNTYFLLSLLYLITIISAKAAASTQSGRGKP